jgi:Flp pilus assembly protein TadG
VIARLRERDGQAMLMTVLFLGILVGAAGLTIDVGAWYREQRQAQATADAAALAGAQALPTDPAQALDLAERYAAANGGGVTPAGIGISQTGSLPNDTVTVDVSRNAPGFFSKLFSFASVDVGAKAAARAGVPEQVWGAAPIVVNKAHPLLSGPGCPCFDVPTTLPLGKDGAPGAFGLADLNGGANGTPELADWIQSGYDGYLPLGDYDSDPGAKFNSSSVKTALNARLNTTLLFPVYDTLTGQGANASYDVIGWVAFHLTGYGADSSCQGDPKGNSAVLCGYFQSAIWQGLQSNTPQPPPNFGLYSVSLVN